MARRFRLRFWVEAGLAATAGSLALVTPIFPDWVELVAGWGPDRHDGSVEWSIVVDLFVVSAAMGVMAALEWRRTPAGAST